jgi:leader peptidase (prepilin peptidase)/N-methyltransferase
MNEVFLFIFGLILGSFLNVCIYRIPHNESILFPPSHCPFCGAHIRWFDNIPLLSYIILKGKCRNCKVHIPIRYPIVEFLSAIVLILLYEKFSFSFLLLKYTIFSYALFVISFIDVGHLIVPDKIVLPLIVLGILFSLPHHILGSVIGAVSGFVLFVFIAIIGRILFKKEALGGGDIKLITACGAFLGIQGVILTTFLSALIGSISGIYFIIFKKSKTTSQIPYAPFISIAAFFCIFYGRIIIRWYLNA